MSERDDRERYRRGLDDYHDPLAGIGGAPPARSALTLRMWLAGFGLVFCAAAAAVIGYLGSAVWAAVLGVIAAIAAVNLAWVARRKRGGEPG
jgi:Family of unknown function (DUF6343)